MLQVRTLKLKEDKRLAFMVTEEVRGKAKPDLCPAKQVGQLVSVAWFCSPFPVDTGLRGVPCFL